MSKDSKEEKSADERAADKAKAEHYIKLRRIKETKEYYESIMDREGRDYTLLMGQVFPPYQEFLRECGFSIEEAGHITWKLTRQPKLPTELSENSQTED